MKPAVRALLALQLVLVSTAAAEQFAVYQSTDRGRSWSRAGQGLPAHSRINAFASLDNMIFAGTNAGVFLSRDAGRTWLPTVVSDRIVALATLGASLYAATASAGILLSTDRGATWASSLNFPVARVRSLLGAGGQLYAGTDSGAVLVSRNAGPTWSGAQPTWRSLEPGLPAPAQVSALAALDGRLFAALYAQGLYSFSIQEERWIQARPVTPLVLATVGDTLVAGHNPGGIFWSSDAGLTWLAHGGELPRHAPIWALGASSDLILAGAADGIFYSEDRGRNWVRARTGLPVASPGVAFLARDGLVLAGVSQAR